jgi:hypothetical protein
MRVVVGPEKGLKRFRREEMRLIENMENHDMLYAGN